ncbi:hypothetical protein DFJ58DRAFT_770211 [Suillus subalutaceus]|uniref:uncharacterized protein n=1 Tax=Suillus subalutaceus TaxID=48586 RepID=UPI001B8712C0|nr:uncharacterized protein DFJ58DRAFT_770211 [Suillus subalutaceus]KAG1865785.1 hypothetical protein DFJ58DRAFT_770211 [Suillus subalutaceus]
MQMSSYFRFVFGVPYHISQIMRLSFVLAVVAAFKLTASMAIRGDSDCPESCTMGECCLGYYCQVIIVGDTDVFLCVKGDQPPGY